MGQKITTNYPESWTLIRKEGKKEQKKLIDYVIQGVALAALLLISIPMIPILALGRGAGKLRESFITTFGCNNILPAVRSMKNEEESTKFQAMKDVLNAHLNINNPEEFSVTEITNHLTSDIHFEDQALVDIQAEKYRRLIVKELSKQNHCSPALIEGLREWKIPRNSINEDGTIDWNLIPSTNDIELDSELQKIKVLIEDPATSEKMRRKLLGLIANFRDAPKQTEEFSARMGKLVEILEDKANLQGSNPAEANRKFLEAYRAVLNHPVYKSFKLSQSHRAVVLLHDLSAAIWNSVNVTDAYKNVGKAIIEDGDLAYKMDDPAVFDNKLLAEKLRESQNTVVSNHYHNDGLFGRINYALMHFWQTMGAMASEGGVARYIPFIFGVDQYDSHGTLSNNPSHQGVTEWRGEGCSGKVNNCYGGSPTIGDHRIAPEFQALLQAAENNLMSEEHSRRKSIPLKVVYTSLQNLDKKHGEGPRSKTIMHLNEAFPLSFTGIILAKDSPLYHMKKSKDSIWTDEVQFGRALKQKLMLGVSDPKQSGHGFYFSGSMNWESLFDAIMEEVNKEFKGKLAISSDEKEMFQNAYQDYVYSLIGAALERHLLGELNKMGVNDPTITTITACKENIDRGGMENMKYLYLRLKKVAEDKAELTKEEILEHLVGFMNVRSLSSRDRAILKGRMEQVLPFIEMFSPENFDDTLSRVFKKMGIKANYTFEVPSKPEQALE